MPGLLSSTVSPSIVSSGANSDQSQEEGVCTVFYPSDIGSILSLYIKTQRQTKAVYSWAGRLPLSQGFELRKPVSWCQDLPEPNDAAQTVKDTPSSPSERGVFTGKRLLSLLVSDLQFTLGMCITLQRQICWNF